MIPVYLSIYFLVLLVALRKPKSALLNTDKLIYFGLCLLLLLFCVFRDGNQFLDYGSYVHALKEDISLGEPTFLLIVWIVKKILWCQPLWLFAIYGFISIFIKGFAISRLTTLPFLSLLFLTADFFILQELTQMRAAVATGLLLWGIQYLRTRQATRYFLTCITASLFHFSGLLMFPLWLLDCKKINRPLWTAVFIVLFTLAFLKIDFIVLVSAIPYAPIQEKINLYLALQEMGDYEANIFSLLFIGKALITFVLLIFINYVSLRNDYAIITLKIMMLSLFMLLAFSQNMALGLRTSEFYGVASIILFPFLYYIIKDKVIARCSIVIVASILLYIRIYSQGLIIS